MAGAPPPQIFKTPKITPGKSNFKIKSTKSMHPTVQAAQPTQWDLASNGVPPMRTNVAYDLGQNYAFETLGLVKEAAPVGFLGALGGLGKAVRSGWGGQNLAGRAIGKDVGGAAGALHTGGQYMKRLMRSSPGAAAGIIGVGGAGAALLGNRLINPPQGNVVVSQNR